MVAWGGGLPTQSCILLPIRPHLLCWCHFKITLVEIVVLLSKVSQRCSWSLEHVNLSWCMPDFFFGVLPKITLIQAVKTSYIISSHNSILCTLYSLQTSLWTPHYLIRNRVTQRWLNIYWRDVCRISDMKESVYEQKKLLNRRSLTIPKVT